MGSDAAKTKIKIIFFEKMQRIVRKARFSTDAFMLEGIPIPKRMLVFVF